jgi:hypothetical protein
MAELLLQRLEVGPGGMRETGGAVPQVVGAP